MNSINYTYLRIGVKMFRKMRRIKQELPKDESIKILENNSSGVLSVSGDQGYPYAVPLNYVYMDGDLFFHTAKQGHLLDGISNSNKVSFCVIGQEKVIPQEFTTYYTSVIAFGEAEIIEDIDHKRRILENLAEKYSPGLIEQRNHEINKTWTAVSVIQLHIKHMTGKASMKLINNKNLIK